MNKDEILAATDEQLNQWATEKVMGYQFDRTKGLFWNGGGDWFHAHKPVTRTAQAMGLLEHLRETRGGWWHSASPHTDYPYFHVVIFADGKGDIPPQAIASKSDKSLPRAITMACLLAVVEMDKQTAAAGDAAKEGAG